MEELIRISDQANGNVHGPIYTSKEVEELGIPSTQPVPKPEKCKYCGKTLYYECVVLMGQAMIWNLEKPRCDCAKAVEFWKRWDAKQEELRKAQAIAEEQEQKRRKIEAILGRSGIKKRYLSRSFENFIVNDVNRKAYEIAKSYVDNWQENKDKGEGLYFEGTCGTGKTHLAVAIAMKLINQGVPVICKTSIDLLASIKQSYERDSTVNEEDVIEAYNTVDLLVIDDLGKERATEWSVPILYRIINDRYENMLPTVITTNYNTDDLIDKLNASNDNEKAEAIISRFKGSASCVTMAWEDYRRKKYD
jgi:DNA replication protein DnaC|nr:MAG TPA: Replicative helicase [Caudoviricetes sp.]